MSTLAASMLRNRTEAEDVVEDALLKIHDAAPGFRGERGLRTWTLRIVANLCRDRLRRRRFQANLPPDELPEATTIAMSVNPQSGWDEALDHVVLAQALGRALATLADEQREVVVMRHRLGLTHAEIAETLNVPEGTVKSRLSRALAALRVAMREQLG